MSDKKFDEQEMRASLAKLNEMLAAASLPKLDVIRPEDCIPQEINARFMDQQMMKRLTDNIARDGHLESTPLVCHSPDTPGKYGIISGHHRIEAAVKANVRWIIVMVITVADLDELRAKQLSHNAIEGEDDEVILQKMYDGLKDLQTKLYSGLQDKLQPVNVVSLSFRAGSFQSFTVAFLPGDIEDYDKAVETIRSLPVTSSSVVRLEDLKSYDTFSKAIRETKKVEDIKSSAGALSALVALGLEKLAERKAEKAEAAKAAAETQESETPADGAGKVKEPKKGGKKAASKA